MIGEACLFSRGGWLKIKTTMSQAWDIFPDSSRKNREDGKERERMKRDWGAMRLVDKGRKGNPGWLLTTIV